MNNPDVSDIGIILFMWCQKWMCQTVWSRVFLNFMGRRAKCNTLFYVNKC